MAISSKLTVPTDGMVIVEDTVLEPGVYVLPSGIRIGANNITLDCNGAVLIGVNREGRGITCVDCSGVTIKNAKLREYYHGIYCKNCENITITENQVIATAEIPANTIFLDIWLPADQSYGGGIFLWDVKDSNIVDNDVQHQMNGILTYECQRIVVARNNASYNSGYGIHLWGTCDSTFEDNYADYCCRWNVRVEGQGHTQLGHMGADATGFLIVRNSCRNVFRRNFARLGGDGFFLAGLNPSGEKVPCNDNLFEENDGSLSPNIAFEATFSGGNIFRNNHADRCNYGFWLGFSWDNVIEDNRMVHNRQAGIAVENGHGMVVRRNTFHSNAHGVLLWTRYVDKFAAAYPESNTSYDWLIEKNTFTRNGKAVCIAADRDHGIRSAPEEECGKLESRPHDHIIRENEIQDNRIAVDLFRADRTVIENNIMTQNVETNIRAEDTSETTVRNNLGSVAGYL
ncbi:MAG TPA: right-handed parallel beta-helix repeat-containing protein [Armatimonadota bacterium]|nr:right-handed parallel beta-helix repeat-containing protein [Armatimonadota bacterium]